MALALAFSAWASLLKAESNMRVVFALFGVLMFVAGIASYFLVPAIG